MRRTNRNRHRLTTFGLCLVVLLACLGYFAGSNRWDRVTDGSVSLVAAVATTGIVVNAAAIYRER